MEYDGGHPVTLFEIHVLQLSHSQRSRSAPIPDIVYHVNAGSRRLVTREVNAGHTYRVRAVATNLLGPSEDLIDSGKC